MELKQNYSDRQLEKIVDEATIAMCACPAQVAGMISKLRQLFTYQKNCGERGSSEVSEAVHERIALATSEAHLLMEQCMQDILLIEGWDETTLDMPAGLRQQRDQSLLE